MLLAARCAGDGRLATDRPIPARAESLYTACVARLAPRLRRQIAGMLLARWDLLATQWAGHGEARSNCATAVDLGLQSNSSSLARIASVFFPTITPAVLNSDRRVRKLPFH